MSPTFQLWLYCGLAVLLSLGGGWLPHLIRLTHNRMQLLLSFIGGAMLGVSLLHLIPHAWHELGDPYSLCGTVLGGFLAMFFLERVFHFHHHDAVEGDADGGHSAHCTHGTLDHSHAPHPPTGQQQSDLAGEGRLTWPAALAGLVLHSVLDGMALAASVAAEPSSTTGWGSVAVCLVVCLHKPFDSLTLAALMAVAGQPARTRHLVNLLFATSIPLGALLFHLGLSALSPQVVGYSLAFAAGTFLCLATSDLLPELHFHSHDRFKLSAALLAGVGIAAVLVVLEEASHDHPAPHGNDPHAHSAEPTGVHSHGEADPH